jgi:hypothetical protein
MTDRQLLAWTRARAVYEAACEWNRASLSLSPEVMNERARHQYLRDIREQGRALHELEQEHAAFRNRVEAAGLSARRRLYRVVASQLKRFFRSWEQRGRLGGAAYVARLVAWLKANRDEVLAALPRLRGRWPGHCKLAEQLARGALIVTVVLRQE